MKGANRICFRTFSIKPDVSEHHAYLTGRDMGGLSPRLQVVDVEETDTLRDVRTRIETCYENGMLRRPLIYSELLHLMHTAKNKSNYEKKTARYEYRLAICPRPHPTATDIPYVVPKRLEKHMRVLSVPIVDSFPTIVCLPVTQIDPKTDQIPGFGTRKDYEESWYMPSIAKAIQRFREEESSGTDGSSHKTVLTNSSSDEVKTIENEDNAEVLKAGQTYGTNKKMGNKYDGAQSSSTLSYILFTSHNNK